MSTTVLDHISLALAQAADHDANTVAAPIAVLWPDEARHFEALIPVLRADHRIVTYGPYDPDTARGPAYWLRCVIAATIDVDGPTDQPTVVYLPGVSRNALRGLDIVDAQLAPLSALQHRCQWFTHPNGKDWTARALLANADAGLGLNIATDAATTAALVAGIVPLAGQTWERLETKHLDADYLNALLSPDPVRSLLDWLDDPATMRAGLDTGAWAAFVQQSIRDYGIDPATCGELAAARRLGEANDRWEQVWHRFRENPADYPRIPERLRAARPDALFTDRNAAWPQDNEVAEDQLRSRLADLATLTADGARNELARLEHDHRTRRSSVWAQLGQTPLANALEHLAQIADGTSSAASPAPGATVDDIADWYATVGWRTDRAVLAALAEVRHQPDVAAVAAAIGATYRPWLDTTAHALQAAVGPAANAGTYAATPAPTPSAGEVIVFIDGLRLDVAHLLADRLDGAGLDTDIAHALAALPTVTQTSKPALVPIDQQRLAAGSGLDARRAPDGPSANVAVLRTLMTEEDIQVLSDDDVGDPAGIAWTETGKIDSRGHERGVELVYEIDDQVQRIATRIHTLLTAGWQRVTIVTDHGWLLLPGGLPKNDDLPVAVTDTKKGRCARVNDGAALSVPTVPWHWDRDVRIALAPGISCFTANQTYEHGGVSPQECVVPRLSVTRPAAATSGAAITNIKWRGLTLVVEFDALPDGAKVDLRRTAGDATSSIAERAMVTSGVGKVILLVGDDDLEGQPAQLVVAASDGTLLLQRATTVGVNR
jgi:hypothetical protein